MGSHSGTLAPTRDSNPPVHPKARIGRLLPTLLGLVLLGLSPTALHAAESAACPDNDNDGYAVCSDECDPSGKPCGDCNDGNAGINPGALERCNGVDDNCNGLIDGADPTFPAFDPVEADGIPVDDDGDGVADEGYGFCVFHESPGLEGVCKTGGILVCKNPAGPVTYEASPGDNLDALIGRGVFTCENTPSAIIEYAEESLAAGNCFDGVDNDCDGRIDVLDEPACQEPEKCDGLDNDGDGVIDNDFDVGTICTVGVGICQRNGVQFCNAAGERTECSAEPGAPKQEGTIHGLSCANGVDDDCDGLVDLADPD
ncbi:putative metal-binding motif-containing protein, partial [Thiocapsa sp. C3-sup]